MIYLNSDFTVHKLQHATILQAYIAAKLQYISLQWKACIIAVAIPSLNTLLTDRQHSEDHPQLHRPYCVMRNSFPVTLRLYTEFFFLCAFISCMQAFKRKLAVSRNQSRFRFVFSSSVVGRLTNVILILLLALAYTRRTSHWS